MPRGREMIERTTPEQRIKMLDILMGTQYDSLSPAEKLAVDIYRTNLDLKKALDIQKRDVPVLTNKVDPWENRSEGMLCRTCMWWVPKKTDPAADVTFKGRCRRHSPAMGGYPVVFDNDWCGDHKLG